MSLASIILLPFGACVLVPSLAGMLAGFLYIGETSIENSFIIGLGVFAFSTPFALIGAYISLFPFYYIITASKRAKNTLYAITNKNVIYIKEFMGLTLNVFPFHKISSIDISIGILEKRCGVGTLIIKGIATENSIDITEIAKICRITKPHEVRKEILKKIQYMKTD